MTFETVLILQPKETEFANKKVKVYTDFLQKHSKKKVKVAISPTRKLPYPIKVKDPAYTSGKGKTCTTGIYVTFEYSLDGLAVHTTINEFEEAFKEDPIVLQFLTIKTEEDEDYESEGEDYKSEQEDNPETEQPDAEDVLLGLAKYNNYVYVLQHNTLHNREEHTDTKVYKHFSDALDQYHKLTEQAKQELRTEYKANKIIIDERVSETDENGICRYLSKRRIY